MPLSAAQRYDQAIAKARIGSRRDVRMLLAGEIDSVECTMDQQRSYLIAEIEAAILAEREACAKVADNYAQDYEGFTEEENAAEKIAALIRDRSNTK